eukprot:TRINITY_DN5379_c0_g1_i1.p1 TRINITY_DN5379_c0_g1~~TRINITY_DN5379_c0_g1_i1.p1  ORF type:complete len:771 (+),score=262.24 TRINITY_DN5379_c0_g1_i1:108-2420(+)
MQSFNDTWDTSNAAAAAGMAMMAGGMMAPGGMMGGMMAPGMMGGMASPAMMGMMSPQGMMAGMTPQAAMMGGMMAQTQPGMFQPQQVSMMAQTHPAMQFGVAPSMPQGQPPPPGSPPPPPMQAATPVQMGGTMGYSQPPAQIAETQPPPPFHAPPPPSHAPPPPIMAPMSEPAPAAMFPPSAPMEQPPLDLPMDMGLSDLSKSKGKGNSFGGPFGGPLGAPPSFEPGPSSSSNFEDTWNDTWDTPGGPPSAPPPPMWGDEGDKGKKGWKGKKGGKGKDKGWGEKGWEDRGWGKDDRGKGKGKDDKGKGKKGYKGGKDKGGKDKGGGLPPPPPLRGGKGEAGYSSGPPGADYDTWGGQPGLPPPPPGGPPGSLPPPPGGRRPPAHGGSLAPELLALTEAAESGSFGGDYKGSSASRPALVEKKPRIVLLLTRLSAEVTDGQMMRLLEQCGEVQIWRRARGPEGQPLSFGFAMFGDAEAAWKVSTCLSKRVLCGSEVKVLVEEGAEAIMKAWRESQKAALKVSSDEELSWELERKTVSCNALIEAKIEEVFGPATTNGKDTGGAGAQRLSDVKEREEARVERFKKRKAWREAEYAKELEKIESDEKRLRIGEKESDEKDREAEAEEIKAKAEEAEKLAKMEEVGATAGSAMLAKAAYSDARSIYELVDRVQAEPRYEIFKMTIDINFLREEKILEQKLRPWLAKKVDTVMGGEQADIVEYILRRVNAAIYPENLISELQRYLDDDAEALVERMWRMLVFELTRAGEGLDKRE